jgi:uncharacterized protein YndB with AHSA1/START domain
LRGRPVYAADSIATEGGDMSTKTETATQTHSVFIRATPEQIWEAITSPEWVARYGYGGRLEIDLRDGGSYELHPTEEMKQYGMPEILVDGDILDVDAPHRLVETWHANFEPEIAAEPAGRVTWEIEAAHPLMFPSGGVTKVSVSHELEDAPRTARIVSGGVAEAGGGWAFVLSDLKSVLETGKTLTA